MTTLRPTLDDNKSNRPVMTNGTAYLMILQAVKHAPGLIHGKLHDGGGAYCAIGSYFETNNRTALPSDLVDEVAAVNDSVPHMTKRQRKLYVAKWLRWKLGTLGYGQFVRKSARQGATR